MKRRDFFFANLIGRGIRLAKTRQSFLGKSLVNSQSLLAWQGLSLRPSLACRSALSFSCFFIIIPLYQTRKFLFSNRPIPHIAKTNNTKPEKYFGNGRQTVYQSKNIAMRRQLAIRKVRSPQPKIEADDKHRYPTHFIKNPPAPEQSQIISLQGVAPIQKFPPAEITHGHAATFSTFTKIHQTNRSTGRARGDR